MPLIFLRLYITIAWDFNFLELNERSTQLDVNFVEDF